MNMSNELGLIGVPYGFGVRDYFTGNGPRALFANDELPAFLSHEGLDFNLEWVDADEPESVTLQLPEGDQMSRTLAQIYQLRELVADAKANSRFPLVSAGNCNSALGVVGGLAEENLGIVWLDAHADASTPETSVSGFFDGMPLAIINGQCYQPVRESIPGFSTIPEDRIVSVGMHDLQEGRPGPIGQVVNRARIDEAGGLKPALTVALDELSQRTDRVYLHIDTDVLDSRVAAVHKFAANAVGGFSATEVEAAIDLVFERFTVLACNLTAFDPTFDSRTLPVVRQFGQRIVELASKH